MRTTIVLRDKTLCVELRAHPCDTKALPMMRPDNRQATTRSHPTALLLAEMIRDAGSASTPALVFGLGCGLDIGFDPANPAAGLRTSWPGMVKTAALAHGMRARPSSPGDYGVVIAELLDGRVERATGMDGDVVSLTDGRSLNRSLCAEVWTIDGASRPATANDVAASLAAHAKRMDSPATSLEGLEGLAALVAFVTELDASPESRNAAERISKDILLHAGGGAAWRRFYRDYLNAASALLPRLGPEQLAISMTRVGDTWQTLGEELGRQASQELPSWEQAAKYAIAVQTFEETYWERVKVLYA